MPVGVATAGAVVRLTMMIQEGITLHCTLNTEALNCGVTDAMVPSNEAGAKRGFNRCTFLLFYQRLRLSNPSCPDIANLATGTVIDGGTLKRELSN